MAIGARERGPAMSYAGPCALRGVPLPDADTVHRIKRVIRDSLKLAADARIDDDMPLIGGEYDLDSLDILLLVTNIEKEFGIKIPNESVGRDVFTNVTALVSFVERHRKPC